MLKITNTLTGEKEPFIPRDSSKVALYVCGITPYSRSHIGHGRCYVAFDVFYRLLRLLGYDVTYCRNFTDIDDKLINRALKEFGRKDAYLEIAHREIVHYRAEMLALGNLDPDVEPRVTENIPAIISYVEALIASDYAYERNGDVYFRVSRASGYPQLSKHRLEDLRAGERVDVNEEKEDPLDFALWKSDEDFWDSPWGKGRPGWHIECSVLAGKYLGEHIDVHGGGMDLKFPHHDNEIAQSEARYGPPFAKYWMHNGLVHIGEEKMSKSLGNTFLLHEVFKKYDPMVIRFLFLKHHYRAPLEFSEEALEMARKTYLKLCRAFESDKSSGISDLERVRASRIATEMFEFLCDDLNTVGMIAVLFDQLSSVKTPEERVAIKVFVQEVLGLSLNPIAEPEVEITPEVQKLIDEREAARAAKDWKRSDEIRDQLQAMGVSISDKKSD